MDERPSERRKARPGSARYRQQRRKERGLMAQKQGTSRPSGDRQVAPVGGFKMPDIKLPLKVFGGVGYVVIAIGLVVGMIYLLRLFNPPEAVTLPNGIWLGTGWSYDLPQDEAVIELGRRLEQNRIGKGYVWVSYLTEELTWGGKRADRDPVTGEVTNTINPRTNEPYQNELSEMEPNIIQFVQQYKEHYPEGKLYGWISYPADIVPLDDEDLHTRVAELSVVLITTYGFDGIFLDVEPVLDGDQNFLQLLRTVRRSLDEVEASQSGSANIPLAVAIPPDWRPTDSTIPYGPGFTAPFEWGHDYKQSVALLVDEMLLMAYHSGLERAEDYSTWVAYQTLAYASAVGELDIPTEVLVGVPTYPYAANFRPDLPAAHDPAVENISTAVAGVNSGLVQAGEAADVIKGLTIFAEWTTDSEEWAMFQTDWVSKQAN